ncbi:MAG: aconitase/3-isopropylmalate dehydratase large subunit family protein [Acidobacteria bacterium]|nr:aconitase/3-isopropylmalate dehydratase large subunit family protein [Acidobacteriota bacterium]
MTIIEKIIALHSGRESVFPGDIVNISIDSRVARDFGGANVVKHIEDNGLSIDDPSKTFFTFDCNPTGSDQKYAENQQKCRIFARKWGIKVFDINSGIGTHIAIDKGLAYPSSTFVSTDSHANILGAIGAFGQGMGDIDIAAAFAYGKVWFKVPHSIKIVLEGTPKSDVEPKDVALFLLKHYGANGLLGVSAEIYGEYAEKLDLSGRITISSMATEMGAIIIFFPPNEEIVNHFRKLSINKDFEPIYADKNAQYLRTDRFDLTKAETMVSRPGHPEDAVPIREVLGKKVDSVFIGSCTNGRIEDLRAAAEILRGKKIAENVVLKIVPSTDEIWEKAMNEGLFKIFKDAGALISNAGCGGCAAGQVGQNGPNEVTVSTGNRNFAGKQGKGEVYLASPKVAAASAIAGFITDPSNLNAKIEIKTTIIEKEIAGDKKKEKKKEPKPLKIKGRVWVIKKDNIDTDMIFHNKHLAITKIEEMGQFAFGNLKSYEDFPKKAKEGDIIVVGENFGAGSSRQQAVDCFIALKTGAVIAKSFGAIYERNAINSGFPIVVSALIDTDIKEGEMIEVDFEKGEIKRENGQIVDCEKWSPVQKEIYLKGGLL